MNKKDHYALSVEFKERFANLFDYEHCTLLFISPCDGALFRYINAAEDKSPTNLVTGNNRKSVQIKGQKEFGDDYLLKLREELVCPFEYRLPKDQGVTRDTITLR